MPWYQLSPVSSGGGGQQHRPSLGDVSEHEEAMMTSQSPMGDLKFDHHGRLRQPPRRRRMTRRRKVDDVIGTSLDDEGIDVMTSSTLGSSDSESSGALKNEMRRQSRPGRQSRRRLSLASDSDTSVATSVIYQSRDHRRSRSLTRGGGESQLNVPQRPPQLVAPPQPPVGYWTYVPDAPVWTTAPMGRRYVPRMMSTTNPSPPVYGTTTKSLLGGATTQPSKPNLSVFISPRSHGGAVDGDVIKKADVYIVDPSFRNRQQQQQIRRSSSMTRLNHDDDVIIMDSPLMTSSTRLLNTSLDRAVRSAQLLRDKTRRMYSHVRDDVDRSQLFADTF